MSGTRSEDRSAVARSDAGRTMSDRVLGFIGGAMVFVALLLLVFGGPPEGAGVAEAPPPTLSLLAPSSGETVRTPLRLTFQSGAPISNRPGGWGTESYHIHAEIDGREAMPAPDDIRVLGGGRYEWTVVGVRPGEIRVRLYWADREHRPLEAEASPEIRIGVEE